MNPALASVLAVAAAFGVSRVITERVIRQRAVLTTNHRGLMIPSAMGIGPAVGVIAAMCATAVLERLIFSGIRLGYTSLLCLTIGAFAGLGLYEDLTDDTRGRDVGAFVLALATGLGAQEFPDALLAAGLIAGGALVLTRFDSAPGRACKAALAWTVGITIVALIATRDSVPGTLAIGAAIAVALPVDLRERATLGSAGTFGLGAGLGLASAGVLNTTRSLVLLAILAGIFAAGPRLDGAFRWGPLARLDALGRPADGPVPPAVLD